MARDIMRDTRELKLAGQGRGDRHSMILQFGMVALLVCVATTLGAVTAWGLDTTAAEILANTDRFDNKTVTITPGTSRTSERPSPAGATRTTRTNRQRRSAAHPHLFIRKGAVSRRQPRDGRGRFTKIKTVSSRTFYNEVEASSTGCR
jgi:hypothetical protein